MYSSNVFDNETIKKFTRLLYPSVMERRRGRGMVNRVPIIPGMSFIRVGGGGSRK